MEQVDVVHRVDRFFKLKIAQIHHGKHHHIGLLHIEMQGQKEAFRNVNSLEQLVLPAQTGIALIRGDIGNFMLQIIIEHSDKWLKIMPVLATFRIYNDIAPVRR